MNINCFFGFHNWQKCFCTRCGKARDKRQQLKGCSHAFCDQNPGANGDFLPVGQCAGVPETNLPLKGYLFITPKASVIPLNTIPRQVPFRGWAIPNDPIIHRLDFSCRFLPVVLCKAAAKNRNLDLKIARKEYQVWINTAKLPCRATPLNKHNRKPFDYQAALSGFTHCRFEVPLDHYLGFCSAMGITKSETGKQTEKSNVVLINWDEAEAFVDWLGYRFPTNDEWSDILNHWNRISYTEELRKPSRKFRIGRPDNKHILRFGCDFGSPGSIGMD